MEPSLGRIVLYHGRALGGHARDYAAVIADVLGTEDHAVQLVVFMPPREPAQIPDQQYGAPYSQEPRLGTWRWPERKP